MEKGNPKDLIKHVGKQIPNVWQCVKNLRSEKGKNLPNWPDYIYLPLAAGYAISSNANKLFDSLLCPATITAIASWRVSQGIYRFDTDLYNSLVNQPLDGNIPCDALKRLPEWCVYIETINTSFASLKYHGFFAHLEKDANDGREELRLLLLGDETTLPIPIHIGDWTIEEGIERMLEESKKHKNIDENTSDMAKAIVEDVVPLIQLVLYLCAENVDMSRQPQHPVKRVRFSGQVDVPREQRVWNVGERIGSTIRKDRNDSLQIEKHRNSGASTSKRPHVRRAHWHHYWTGSNENKSLVLRWLPPTFIGGEEEIPIVIHKVK